jgi:hypothetical protein
MEIDNKNSNMKKDRLHSVTVLVLVTLAIISTGCSTLLDSGTESLSQPEETPTEQQTPELTPVNGTDVRSISLVAGENVSVTGEIDGSDPRQSGTGTPYEPINFTAESDTEITLTMEAEGKNPMLALYNSNGTLIKSVKTNKTTDTARLGNITLYSGGEYTVDAASSGGDKTFQYKLTAHYTEPLFSGDPKTWNKDERYLEFAGDYGTVANDTSGNLTHVNHSVSVEDDYAIITYEMDPNSTVVELADIDRMMLYTYENLYSDYINESNQPANKSWIPRRIYHRGISPDGKLIRTTYIERSWAAEYQNATDMPVYASRYMSTRRVGPTKFGAYENITESNKIAITEEEFPMPEYNNTQIDPDFVDDWYIEKRGDSNWEVRFVQFLLR